MPRSMWCSTASTTTIASSTTSHGEDQAEEREGVDGEAEEREEGEGPTSDTGTARSGMSVALHPWRKMNTTMMTRASASKRVLTISLIPSETARWCRG